MQDGLHDASESTADSIISRTLALDNRVSGIPHLLVDFLPHLLREIDFAHFDERFQGHAANRHQRPREHFRIAMLAYYMRMNVLRIDSTMISKKTTKSCGVQGGPRTQHATGRH